MGLFKGIFNNKKTCIIAEKYSVALDYSKALKCIKKNNCFENSKYIIVWTDGHLCTLYNPEDYDEKYRKWRLDDLPIDPNGFWVKVRPSKKSKLDYIRETIERKDIDRICIATDSAREGNLIGEYTLMAIKNKKPVYRAMINSYIKNDIINGIREMKLASLPEIKNITLAAQARDEIDWLIGTNLSRAYSLIYNNKYYVGRCKTVILNLICIREEEIINSDQKIYYAIIGEFLLKSGAKYKGNLQMHVSNEELANKIKKAILNKVGTVEKINKKIETIHPDPLFNLNDLIIAASRRLKITAEETYTLAQTLYEKYKVISYARTDSRYIKKSMANDIKETLNLFKDTRIKGIKDISLFANRCIDDSKVIEHTAIVPLNIKKGKLEDAYKNFTEKEKNLYELIVENFISNFLEDYIYESYKIDTKVDEYSFVSYFQKPVQLGWQQGNLRENNFIDIKENDQVNLTSIRIEKKLTKLPERYTDASLFSVMADPGKFVKDKPKKKIIKDQGIGTNATRALLIKDLIKNGYILRENGYILPTIEGLNIINNVKTDNLKSPGYTAEIEEKLQLLQEGKIKKDLIINDVRAFIKEHINNLKSEYKPVNNRVIGICPKCRTGKIVKAGDKGYGCTNFKTLGCRFFVSREILGVEIDPEQVKKLIDEGETDAQIFEGPKDQFKAKIILDKQFNTKFRKEVNL